MPAFHEVTVQCSGNFPWEAGLDGAYAVVTGTARTPAAVGTHALCTRRRIIVTGGTWRRGWSYITRANGNVNRNVNCKESHCDRDE